MPEEYWKKVVMLKRKANSEFEKWYAQAVKKALFVEGARQVGKTTTIRQFCKSHYENVIEINFVKNPIAKQVFDGNLDADTIVMNLSAMGYGPFKQGKTVVFMDEIQDCPNARTAVKFLVEDGRFDYIESSSLLGINYEVMNGMIDINEGALTENFVAAEFAKKGHPLFYYDKKSKHELDFLLTGRDGAHIVEVKSGDNYRSHASLDYALEREGTRISGATVFCKDNLSTEDGITYLPLYMAMFL